MDHPFIVPQTILYAFIIIALIVEILYFIGLSSKQNLN
jgi:uncharacterized membrane protein